jgi:mRNA-degrading endonuclease RelE of RelBE toxin-antitoxin system
VTLRLSTNSRRFYRRLYRSDRKLFERLDRSLERLTDQPQLGKPLVGPLSGHRSLRVGPLRIIYRFETEGGGVLVPDIAARGGAYRDLL